MRDEAKPLVEHVIGDGKTPTSGMKICFPLVLL